jgi:uncharacterized lipoprotein YehR (DUF1307 family)
MKVMKLLSNILISTLLLSLFGCGQEQSSPKRKAAKSTSTQHADQIEIPTKYDIITETREVQEILHKFEHEALIRGLDISEKLKEVGIYKGNLRQNNAYGICYKIMGAVFIDSTFWETESELRKELLLFHELGHCALGRTEHINDTIGKTDIGASIMNYSIDNVPIEFYEIQKEEYLDELFTE